LDRLLGVKKTVWFVGVKVEYTETGTANDKNSEGCVAKICVRFDRWLKEAVSIALLAYVVYILPFLLRYL